MHSNTLISLLALPILAAHAAPQGWGVWGNWVVDDTSTCPTGSPPPVSTTTTAAAAVSTASSAPLTSPTAPYSVISVRSGSPIHLLPLNAYGALFFLGGNASTYCPTSVVSDCPPGDTTVFVGLGGLDVEVPGGQVVYVGPDGSLGFTEPHSDSYPIGSVLSPLTYYKDPTTSIFGDVGTDAFGATGFMACPTDSGFYQVFAALDNATVPNGNVSLCLGFDALTLDYDLNPAPAAWEYT